MVVSVSSKEIVPSELFTVLPTGVDIIIWLADCTTLKLNLSDVATVKSPVLRLEIAVAISEGLYLAVAPFLALIASPMAVSVDLLTKPLSTVLAIINLL